MRLMDIGNSTRTVAATNMNDTSSRSHALFTITFTQVSFEAGLPSEKTSKVNLVDLAGSERTSSTGATGKRLKEGGSINKSLTTLGIVIEQLAKRTGKGANFIPYRDSVLTWLLRESLGGNLKTIMLAAISTADVNYGETLSTLHYANRAKNIVNKPIVNEDENVRIIRELRKEVEELKNMLGDAKVNSDLTKQIEQSEQLMSALTDAWGDKWKVTTTMMESRQLKLQEKGVSVVMESERPHLVDMNMDALASGITLHYLKDGATTFGGESCDIPLSGEGVEESHCSIDFENDTAEQNVHLLPASGRCVIDNMPVETKIQLMQGMTMVLGATNIFRFNHPRQARELREKRDRGELDMTATSRLSTPFGFLSRASPDPTATTADDPLPDFNTEQENADTLQFKLLELQAEQEEKQRITAEQSAQKDRRLAELEAELQKQKEKEEVEKEKQLERVRAKVISEHDAQLSPHNTPGRQTLRPRADSASRAMLARGSSLVHMPDLDEKKGKAYLEAMPDNTFENCVASQLDILALQQLRLCSRRLHALVDSLLPRKNAWLGWDALMSDGDDPSTWEYRLLHFPYEVMAPDVKNRVFKACCGHGHTHITNLFVETHNITAADVLADAASPFRAACKNGHRVMAEWLADEYDITKDVATAKDNYCLGEACHFGYVEVARWLVERFGLGLSDIRADGNYAMRMAAAHGHLDVLEWMLNCPAFTLTAKDVRVDDCIAFRLSCHQGHVDVASLLVRHFELGLADIRSAGNYALFTSASEGHIDVVMWLVWDAGLSQDDILDRGGGSGNSPFVEACVKGHVEVAQALAEAGQLEADAHIRDRSNEVLRFSCQEGKHLVVEWLVEHFKLTIDDVRAMENYAIRMCYRYARHAHRLIKKWLL